jgi:hypothetical protein
MLPSQKMMRAFNRSFPTFRLTKPGVIRTLGAKGLVTIGKRLPKHDYFPSEHGPLSPSFPALGAGALPGDPYPWGEPFSRHAGGGL